MRAFTSRRRRLVWLLAAAGAVLGVVAAVVFEPWKLVIDQTVDEAPPSGSSAQVVPGGPAQDAPASQPAEPVVLFHGAFISHEHESSGSVMILQLADGSRVLRLQDLRTSNGPLLRVWLADAPVLAGSEGWHVFDDGRYVDLGDLKGNIGSSNYPVPPEVDLAGLPSVSIWCDRFNVSFAAATLQRVDA
jgi:hypothetical protein